jgi:hypothetical protein
MIYAVHIERVRFRNSTIATIPYPLYKPINPIIKNNISMFKKISSQYLANDSSGRFTSEFEADRMKMAKA